MWPCEECRFDPSTLDEAALVDAVAAIPKRYTAPLTRFLPADDPSSVLRTRPAPAVWSALEYAVHMREAVHFYDQRIRRVLQEDGPQFTAPASWDELCVEGRYNDVDPAVALEQLSAAALAASDRLHVLTPEQWQRTGTGIDGDTRTVRLLAERLADEGHHHLLDIGRSMRAVCDAAKG